MSLGGEASGDATGWTCACPSPTRYSPLSVGPSPCVATTYTTDSLGHAIGSTSVSAQRETPPGEICRTVRWAMRSCFAQQPPTHTRCQTSPTPVRFHLRRLAWPILLRRRQARRQARRLPRSRSLHHERHGGGCHRRNCRHVRGGLAARDRLCLLQVRCQATAGRCQATAAVLIGGGSADGRLGRVGLMHSTSLVGPW